MSRIFYLENETMINFRTIFDFESEKRNEMCKKFNVTISAYNEVEPNHFYDKDGENIIEYDIEGDWGNDSFIRINGIRATTYEVARTIGRYRYNPTMKDVYDIIEHVVLNKEQLMCNIKQDSYVMNKIKKHYRYDAVDTFYDHCKYWLMNTILGKIQCTVMRVANSGMSRQFLYHITGYGTLNNVIFTLSSATPVKDSNNVRIGGCGMDMDFAIRYDIAHRLKRLGFITEEQCGWIAQIK